MYWRLFAYSQPARLGVTCIHRHRHVGILFVPPLGGKNRLSVSCPCHVPLPMASRLVAHLSLLLVTVRAHVTRRVNFTSYRVTPQRITGLVDHDTGDAAGDVYFALYQLTFPLYCIEMPRDSVCHTAVLANTTDNVYRQSVVEADSRFGVYNGCDPQNNGSFICRPYWRDTCWYDYLDFGSKFAGLCDRASCNCSIVTKAAVGAYYC